MQHHTILTDFVDVLRCIKGKLLAQAYSDQERVSYHIIEHIDVDSKDFPVVLIGAMDAFVIFFKQFVLMNPLCLSVYTLNLLMHRFLTLHNRTQERHSQANGDECGKQFLKSHG